MSVLVDSCVLLDVITTDPKWGDWSAHQLMALADHEELVINPLIYSEISVSFDFIEALDAALPHALVRREALPWEAGFLAAKCFVQYRRRGGARRIPLPDFYIGAHAAVKGMALLTRDATRYRTYFPTVRLITP